MSNIDFRNAVSQVWRHLSAVVWNVVLVYVLYMCCRVIYVAENWHLYSSGWHTLSVWEVVRGGFLFDTAAICYTNALWLIMLLLPLAWRERRGYQAVAKWLFVVVNGVMLSLNLVDTVYSQYTGRRTTWSFFQEFKHESNLGSIFGIELLNHWYLLLAGIAMVALLWFLYRKPRTDEERGAVGVWQKVTVGGVGIIVLVVCIVSLMAGIRGGLTYHRPISITTANRFVNQPVETNIVLNTPFSLIRTVGKTSFVNPNYFADEELDGLYSPIHAGAAGSDKPTVERGRNVVVLILESFSQEYFGAYNRDLDDGSYKGYTPFLDSLIEHSLTFRYSFANGRKSIDAMPSVLSSVPMFVEPFILTSASLNDLSGIAGELDKADYQTAFFHGADNGSMGFLDFSKTTGFQEYYGMTEYCADERFDGMNDFDGEWGIFDEPFMKFMALTLNDFRRPFMVSLFSVTSHHPFPLPKQYKEVIPEGTLAIHRGIQYTDIALRSFFRTASQQPWYDSTIFVITADHCNAAYHPEFSTSLGSFKVPIIFFDPSGQLPIGMWEDVVAQQIDITPTLLGFLGYTGTYLAYGIDLLQTPREATWAVNYNNGIYQFLDGDYMLQFDGHEAVGLYRYKEDRLLQNNLLGTNPELEQRMKVRLMAIIQSYMERMSSNRLVAWK